MLLENASKDRNQVFGITLFCQRQVRAGGVRVKHNEARFRFVCNP